MRRLLLLVVPLVTALACGGSAPPPASDAGSPVPDAGSTAPDAGSDTVADAGSSDGADAGTPGCTSAADCPGEDTACSTRTCEAGVCGVSFAAKDSALEAQISGDCLRTVCDGQGHETSVADDSDAPPSSSACETASCAGGHVTTSPMAAGSACSESGGSLCDGAAHCVACLSARDCAGQDTACQARTCIQGACGLELKPNGTKLSLQTAGDCKANVCDGQGGVTTASDDTDVADDGNACTRDGCFLGVPTHDPVAQGSSCNTGVCSAAGTCVGCLGASDCPGQDTECQARTCTQGACGMTYAAAGVPLAQQTAGDCKQSVCDGQGHVVSQNDDADKPVDGNACTSDVCTSGAPSNPATAAGVACSQNGGSLCDGAGACVGCMQASDCATGVCRADHTCLPPTVLLLAGGGSAMLGGEFHPGGAWAATSLPGVTVSGVSLAMTGTANAVGLMRFTQMNNPADNQLQYTTWTPGHWTAFTAIGSGITTRDTPALDAANGLAQAAFLGTDWNFYFTSFSGSAWSSVEATGRAGGSPPSVAALGPNAAMAYNKGFENNLYVSNRTSGAWQPEQLVGNGTNTPVAPTIVRLNGGTADVLAAYVRASDGQITTFTRTSGTWSSAALVAGGTSNDPVALAALANGRAALAFRGQDTKLYTSFFTPGQGWSSPAPAFAQNVAIAAPPALAHGIGAATAEMAFVATDGAAYHTRYVNGAWTQPVAVGGSGLTSVALSSAP